MIDDTPLPVILSDYKGFRVRDANKISEIVEYIVGRPTASELASRLAKRADQLQEEHLNKKNDTWGFLVCPKCKGPKIKGGWFKSETWEAIYAVYCEDCNWNTWRPKMMFYAPDLS